MTGQMAHFVVQGSCLVDVARSLVLSDQPERAMRLLAESIPELPAKIAQQLLDGDKTLAGDSDAGIRVVDESPATRDAFVHNRRFVYAGRVRVGASWLRPRAVVDDRGEEDALWALGALGLAAPPTPGADYRASARYCRLEAELRRDGRMLPGEDLGRAVLRKFTLMRHQHYAGDGERALYVRRAGASLREQAEIVIFEPCGPTPSWWPARVDLAEALDEFRDAGGCLERLGRAARYGRAATSRAGATSAASLADRVADSALGAACGEEDRRDAERIAAYRAEILRRAGGDLFEFSWGAGSDRRTVWVPRAPFEVYATRATRLRELAPRWEPVCPSGLKMQHDDPCHTDWMVGAGLDDLSICYKDAVFREALADATFAVQERLGNFQCAVLADAGAAVGVVALPGDSRPGGVLVLPPPAVEPDYECPRCRAGIRRGQRYCDCGARVDFSLPPGAVETVTTEQTEVVREPWGCDTYLVYDVVPYGYYSPWDPWADLVAFSVLCAVLW